MADIMKGALKCDWDLLVFNAPWKTLSFLYFNHISSISSNHDSRWYVSKLNSYSPAYSKNLKCDLALFAATKSTDVNKTKVITNYKRSTIIINILSQAHYFPDLMDEVGVSCSHPDSRRYKR